MNPSADKLAADNLAKQGVDLATETADQIQAIGKRGFSAVSDATQQALDAASDVTDSLITYTKKNPGTALLLAAASGALLLTLFKVFSTPRD